uniref:Down syndrome cell adhesion molecule-like n=1 Tax=Gouania willdenowi TaxID=441366 RepID=A0A8C5GLQ7_GOUWI
MKVWDRKLLTVSCSFVIFALHVTVSTGTIIATVGTDVTLTCNYDAKYHGKLSVCWGRGDIPNRGCASEVIRSDGTSVISRLSERYLLLGDIDAGDVSLTIRQLQESDSGTYGCRVDIPGWFNDLKYQIILSVNPVRPNPLRIETKEVKERTVTVGWNPVFNGGRPITMYRIDLKNKQASWDTAVRTEMSNPDLTQVTLVDLRPAKTYSLRMFAMNSMGISESSNVLTVTTKEAAPEGPPLDMKLEAINSHRIKVTWKVKAQICISSILILPLKN